MPCTESKGRRSNQGPLVVELLCLSVTMPGTNHPFTVAFAFDKVLCIYPPAGRVSQAGCAPAPQNSWALSRLFALSSYLGILFLGDSPGGHLPVSGALVHMPIEIECVVGVSSITVCRRNLGRLVTSICSFCTCDMAGCRYHRRFSLVGRCEGWMRCSLLVNR